MDDPTDRDGERRREPRKPKPPRKVSPRYLENAALHYLKRYAATVSQLKRVLMRRVDRSVKFHGGDRAEAVGWVDALAEKLIRNNLINDGAYAETKAHSLRASGRSARVITQKLRMKGVAQELVQQKVAEATQDVSEDAAALIWARKKRLGPFRRDPSTRADNRQRDLAALARAGFSFTIAKRVIDGTADEAPLRR
ncbi:RecX family transcriptional regulator [Corallococcus praedator]|uniref:Regulatory protein RecX n=1 Tax=Corallococcus praedator TaxID=2316724 RepID=A0ABX9QKV5_9BACT|nr:MULTISPECIES: regulatory protein RecX [Corallococcus]RKH31656.1 RecX family transcriptional regulator [Corallococcus sp. CA031C]RKI10716.1 RecX family transcriptional regulator [Corallococcus praedator]